MLRVVQRRLKSVSIGSIVIGDEILKGYVNDTNTHFLAKQAFQHGLKLERVAIVPDDQEIIAAHVKEFAATFDYVITSGGIGPTHDDITFESVAAAFDQQCHVNPTLESYVVKFFGRSAPDSPQMKLCTIPEHAHLIETTASGTRFRYPVVTVNNVIILPGVPQLFERSIANLIGLWQTERHRS